MDLLDTYRRLEACEAQLASSQAACEALRAALAKAKAEADDARGALAAAGLGVASEAGRDGAQLPPLPPRSVRVSAAPAPRRATRTFRVSTGSGDLVDAGVESVHGALEFRLLCVSVPMREVVGLRELGPPRGPPQLPPRPRRQPAADAAATPVPPARRPSAPSSELHPGDAASPSAQQQAQQAQRRAASLDLPRTPTAASDSETEGEAEAPPALQPLELVWREGGGRLRRLRFEADSAGYAYLGDALAAWTAAAAAAAAAAADEARCAPSPMAADGHPQEWDETGDDGDGDSTAALPGDDVALGGGSDAADTHVDLCARGPPPTLRGAGADAAGGVLSGPQLAALSGAMPGRTRLAAWQLAYSTRRDGISLRSLLRLAAGRAPTLLAVRDGRGAVFGAYCAEPWRVAPRYFGTGESFVFSTLPAPPQPDDAADALSDGEAPPAPCVRAFRWSGRNAYFQLGQWEAVAVGGGGAYAFKLDGELARGTSGSCDTFASPCLASDEEFDIMHVDLWALDGQ